MKKLVLIGIGLVLAGCSQTARTVVYNETNFSGLASKRNIRVTFVDGNVAEFYRMEVIKVDETNIYARCWKSKKDEPIDYKFVKSEVVIENVEFSTSRSAAYVAGLVLSIGIIFLLQKIIYGG